MTKSNRRRKQDRAKREAKAARQRLATMRQQLGEEVMRLATERRDQMLDPETPPGELAALIASHYAGEPVAPQFAELLLAKGATLDKLASAADSLLAGDTAGPADDAGDPEPSGQDMGTADDTAPEAGRECTPTVTALTFAAAVARAAGDGGRSNRLLNQALAGTDDPDDRTDVIDYLRKLGRVADAVELLEDRLREEPGDGHAARHYGEAIEEAFIQVSGDAPAEACSCGKGPSWGNCCGPRESAALDRFTDRSGLTAVRDALTAFLPRSGHGAIVEAQVSELLSVADDLEWDTADRDALTDIALELSLLIPGLTDEDPPDDDDEQGNALTAFAADASAPAELAARARAWRDYIHYGLWRIEEPRPAPGLWCREIVSGTVRYAQFPPAFADEGMPRWTVWLGGLVPVDGIWCATGAGIRLSPAEADAAAELIQSAVTSLFHQMEGKRRKRLADRAAEPMRIGRAEPHGVLADLEDPASPEVAQFIGMTTGMLLPRIVVEVLERRTTPMGTGIGESPAGWEQHWLDEPVPALRGRTPRQAAESKRRESLEGLLRQLEYEADRLAAEGRSGADTAWLRQELDMEYSQTE